MPLTRGVGKPASSSRRRGSSQDAATKALDASLVGATVVDRNGYPYVVHPLMDGVPRCDPAFLAVFTRWAKGQRMLREATLLAAPEAMGLPLVAALSLATGIPYVIIRKRNYGLAGEQVAYCETGYGQNCLYVNDCNAGDRIVLVDDVVSTGNTLDALLATLKGMDTVVLGALVFIDKGSRRGSLSRRHRVPIRALRTVKVEDGVVRIVRRG